MNAAGLLPADRFSIVALVEGVAPPVIADMLRSDRAHSVPLRMWTQAERNLLGARIDRFVAEADRAGVMVGNGAGCLAAAWGGACRPPTMYHAWRARS